MKKALRHVKVATGEQLKRLLQAHRERDESAFHKVAQSIISDELAANHHALARELKNALGELPKKTADLVVLPRDKRSGESLLTLKDSHVQSDQVVLPAQIRKKIDRILQEHQHSHRLAKFGYTPKRRFLFWGPPGCGKTLTAHYLANELALPIGMIRLSALISSFLGDTATHLQSVFDSANRTPMVLLLDEVDAVGKNRDDKNDVGELKRVVNSLLQAMDHYSPSGGIMIAASNHQYLLDTALWRRFDDIIHFPMPTPSEIKVYVTKLLNGVPIKGAMSQPSKKMEGMAFADIERVVVDAVKTMILEEREVLSASDLLSSVDSFLETASARGKLDS